MVKMVGLRYTCVKVYTYFYIHICRYGMVGLRGGRGGRARREDHDEDELEVSASSSEEVYICMHACWDYTCVEREGRKEKHSRSLALLKRMNSRILPLHLKRYVCRCMYVFIHLYIYICIEREDEL
jgi:hypothetical protein